MNVLTPPTVRSAVRVLALACASLALCAGAQAQGHGQRGGGHFAHGGASAGHFAHGGASAGHFHGGFRGGPRWGYRGGGWPVWGGVGLGIGLGLGSYYYGAPWYATSLDYVVVDPPVVYANPQPVPAAGPQPVIYPRTGQSTAQTDADGNACSQWAGAQPNATVDPSVFRRAISACMDARGYTVR